MPVTPTPVTPIPATGHGGSTYINVSGVVPASGLETALSGPWMIEEQDLGIMTMRMPHYGNITESHSLSGPTRTIAVTQTSMIHVVWANYSIRKSYEIFSLSAWTQPQTFQLNPVSADVYGNSYGEVSMSALGPMATISTKHKWYFRREWKDAIDTEVNQTCQGTQHYFYDMSGVRKDGVSYWGDFKHVRPGSWMANTFLADWDFNLSMDQIYWLGGTYSTSQETYLQIVNYVDRAGVDVRNILFYGLGPDFQIDVNNIPIRNQGCVGYSSSRHNWS